MFRSMILEMIRRSLFVGLGLLLVSNSVLAQVERGPLLPRKASLGAQLAPLSKEKAVQLKAPEGSAEVVRVLPGLTGEAMALKAGDIIQSLDGKPTPTVADVTGLMRNVTGGQAIKVTVLREGKTITLDGKAVERPRQKGDDSITIEYDQVLSQGKRIRVIETHPKGAGPFPTIFWIGGIGAYSLDGEYPGIAYGNIMGPLSKQYAIVRIDKPGQGDSEGPVYTDLLFDVELDAYLQAIRLTKTLSFVDKNKIAIVGHSMGGVFGPLVAQTEQVAAIGAIGTVSKTWTEYMLENTRRQALLGGGSPENVDRDIVNLAAVCHHIFYEGLSPAETIQKYPDLKGPVNGMVPDGKTYSGVGLPFFQQLAKKNMPAAWMKVDAKVAAIWGENDFISTKSDHEFIAEFMNKKKPGSAEFIMIPNSDHGFSNTTSFLDSMQKWGRGGQFNPNIIEILGGWLKRAIG